LFHFHSFFIELIDFENHPKIEEKSPDLTNSTILKLSSYNNSKPQFSYDEYENDISGSFSKKSGIENWSISDDIWETKRSLKEKRLHEQEQKQTSTEENRIVNEQEQKQTSTEENRIVNEQEQKQTSTEENRTVNEDLQTKRSLKEKRLQNIEMELIATKEVLKDHMKTLENKISDLENQISDHETRIESFEKETFCVICWERFANVLYLPCHHQISCSICTVEYEVCSLCWTKIEQKIDRKPDFVDPSLMK